MYHNVRLLSFLSTLSLRRATVHLAQAASPGGISIHALLAESDLRVLDGSKSSIISIHALLAESDHEYNIVHNRYGISIHALLAESDCPAFSGPLMLRLFLSTLSLRRATQAQGLKIAAHGISIHALLAESDFSLNLIAWNPSISIHALLAESDPLTCRTKTVTTISIHALLAESDLYQRKHTIHLLHFYPRSPCGERPERWQKLYLCIIFLSTLSLRRATAKVHKTVGHFCAYGTNFMGIASSC